MNVRSASGATPLMLTTLKDSSECAALLLAAGADPTLADGRGRTVLHFCAMHDAVDVSRMLLSDQVTVRQREDGAVTLAPVDADGTTDVAGRAPSTGSVVFEDDDEGDDDDDDDEDEAGRHGGRDSSSGEDAGLHGRTREPHRALGAISFASGAEDDHEHAHGRDRERGSNGRLGGVSFPSSADEGRPGRSMPFGSLSSPPDGAAAPPLPLSPLTSSEFRRSAIFALQDAAASGAPTEPHLDAPEGTSAAIATATGPWPQWVADSVGFASPASSGASLPRASNASGVFRTSTSSGSTPHAPRPLLAPSRSEPSLAPGLEWGPSDPAASPAAGGPLGGPSLSRGGFFQNAPSGLQLDRGASSPHGAPLARSASSSSLRGREGSRSRASSPRLQERLRGVLRSSSSGALNLFRPAPSAASREAARALEAAAAAREGAGGASSGRSVPARRAAAAGFESPMGPMAGAPERDEAHLLRFQRRESLEAAREASSTALRSAASGPVVGPDPDLVPLMASPRGASGSFASSPPPLSPSPSRSVPSLAGVSRAFLSFPARPPTVSGALAALSPSSVSGHRGEDPGRGAVRMTARGRRRAPRTLAPPTPLRDLLVRTLLSTGRFVDARSTTGRTALHEAVTRRARGVVAALLAADANPVARTGGRGGTHWAPHTTPLHVAVRAGDDAITRALLRAALSRPRGRDPRSVRDGNSERAVDVGRSADPRPPRELLRMLSPRTPVAAVLAWAVDGDAASLDVGPPPLAAVAAKALAAKLRADIVAVDVFFDIGNANDQSEANAGADKAKANQRKEPREEQGRDGDQRVGATPNGPRNDAADTETARRATAERSNEALANGETAQTLDPPVNGETAQTLDSPVNGAAAAAVPSCPSPPPGAPATPPPLGARPPSRPASRPHSRSHSRTFFPPSHSRSSSGAFAPPPRGAGLFRPSQWPEDRERTGDRALDPLPALLNALPARLRSEAAVERVSGTVQRLSEARAVTIERLSGVRGSETASAAVSPRSLSITGVAPATPSEALMLRLSEAVRGAAEMAASERDAATREGATAQGDGAGRTVEPRGSAETAVATPPTASDGRSSALGGAEPSARPLGVRSIDSVDRVATPSDAAASLPEPRRAPLAVSRVPSACRPTSRRGSALGPLSPTSRAPSSVSLDLDACCPICFDNEATHAVAVCGHAHCGACSLRLVDAAKRMAPPPCPICRRPIDGFVPSAVSLARRRRGMGTFRASSFSFEPVAAEPIKRESLRIRRGSEGAHAGLAT